jgi:hypothetical protein
MIDAFQWVYPQGVESKTVKASKQAGSPSAFSPKRLKMKDKSLLPEWLILVDGSIMGGSQSENLSYVKRKARQVVEKYEEGRCQVDVVLAGTDLTHRASYEPGKPLVWKDVTERVAASRLKSRAR